MPTVDVDLGPLGEGGAKLVGNDTLVLAGHLVLHVVQVEVRGVALDLSVASGQVLHHGVRKHLQQPKQMVVIFSMVHRYWP